MTGGDQLPLTDDAKRDVTGFKKKHSAWYFALTGGGLVVVAIAALFLLGDDDDGGSGSNDSTQTDGGSSQGESPPEAPSTEPGSADRLRDLFAPDAAQTFPGMEPVGDVVDQPTANDLWSGLEPQTEQFAEVLGYHDGQTGSFEVEREDPSAIPSGVVSLASIQRWVLGDAESAVYVFDSYEGFVTTSYGTPEEGTVDVGDAGETLLVRSTADPVVSQIVVLLASVDDVALMIQGSCQECTPEVEQEFLGQAQAFAEAFFAP